MVSKKVALSVLAAIPAVVVPSVFTEGAEAKGSMTDVGTFLETNYMKYVYKDIVYTPTGEMVESGNTYEAIISTAKEDGKDVANVVTKSAKQDSEGKITIPIADVPNGFYQVQITEMDSEGNHIASHVYQNNLNVQKGTVPKAELPTQEDVNIYVGKQTKNGNKQYGFSNKLENTNPQIIYTNEKKQQFKFGLERNETQFTIVEAKTKYMPSGKYTVTAEFYDEKDKYLGSRELGEEQIGKVGYEVDDLLTSNIKNNEIVEDIVLTPTALAADLNLLAILHSEGDNKTIRAEYKQNAEGKITIPLDELNEGKYSLQISISDKTGNFISNELWKDELTYVKPVDDNENTGTTKPSTPVDLTGHEVVELFENNFTDNKMLEDVVITPKGKAVNAKYSVFISTEKENVNDKPLFDKEYKPNATGKVVIPLADIPTGKYTFKIAQYNEKGSMTSTTAYAYGVERLSDKETTTPTKPNYLEGNEVLELFENNFFGNKMLKDVEIKATGKAKDIGFEVIMQTEKKDVNDIPPFFNVYKPTADGVVVIPLKDIPKGEYSFQITQLDEKGNPHSNTAYASKIQRLGEINPEEVDYTKYTDEQLKDGFLLGFGNVINKNAHIIPTIDLQNIDYEVVMVKQGIAVDKYKDKVIFSPLAVTEEIVGNNATTLELDKLETGYYQILVRQFDKDRNVMGEAELVPRILVEVPSIKEIPEYHFSELDSSDVGSNFTFNANKDYVLAPTEKQIKLRYTGSPLHENMTITTYIDGKFFGTSNAKNYSGLTPLAIIEDVEKDKVGKIVFLFEDKDNPEAKAKYVLNYGYEESFTVDEPNLTDIPEYHFSELDSSDVGSKHTFTKNKDYVIDDSEPKLKMRYTGSPLHENMTVAVYIDGKTLGKSDAKLYSGLKPLAIIEDMEKDKIGNIVFLFEDKDNPKLKAKYVMNYGYADVFKEDTETGNGSDNDKDKDKDKETEVKPPKPTKPSTGGGGGGGGRENYTPHMDISIDGKQVGKNKFEIGKNGLNFSYTTTDKDDDKSVLTVTSNFKPIYEETVSVGTKTTGTITQLGFAKDVKEVELTFNVRDFSGASSSEHITFIYNPELDKDTSNETGKDKDKENKPTKPINPDEYPIENETSTEGLGNGDKDKGKEEVTPTPSPKPTPTDKDNGTTTGTGKDKETTPTPTPTTPTTNVVDNSNQNSGTTTTEQVNVPTTENKTTTTTKTEKVNAPNEDNSSTQEEVVSTFGDELPQTNTKSQGMAVGMFGAMLALFGAVGLQRRNKNEQTENQ